MIYVEDTTCELITETSRAPTSGEFILQDIATDEPVKVKALYTTKDGVCRCEVLSEWVSRGVDA